MQFGRWLGCCDTVGLEGDFLALGGQSEHFYEWSPGDPILSRPFYDVTRPTNDPQNVEGVAAPGHGAGSVSVDSRTEFEAAGADLRIFLNGCDNCCQGWRTRLVGRLSLLAPQGPTGRDRRLDLAEHGGPRLSSCCTISSAATINSTAVRSACRWPCTTVPGLWK